MPRQNTIQLRKGTLDQWNSKNTEVLASGEPGFETDTLRLKIGNGTTAWSGLNYVGLAGTGTSGYLPKFSGSQTVTNSLIFDNGTNVGIGTASPSGKFHIESAVANNSYVLLSNPGNVIKTHIGVGNSDSVPFLASINNIQLASGIYGWGFFDRETDGNLHIQRKGGGTSWSSVMMMDRSNGNVGIGTTAPSAQLHVNGSGLFSNNIIINGNSPIIELRNTRYTPVGNIALENSDTNFITFRGVGTGLCPTNGAFNSGLKILLRPSTSANQPPVAIGLSNNSLWNVVINTGWNYEWNAGANNLATLSGNGMLSVSSGISTGAVTAGSINVSNGAININDSGVYINSTGTGSSVFSVASSGSTFLDLFVSPPYENALVQENKHINIYGDVEIGTSLTRDSSALFSCSTQFDEIGFRGRRISMDGDECVIDGYCKIQAPLSVDTVDILYGGNLNVNNVNISDGTLTINNGFIQVNDTNGGLYNTVITPTGLKINYTSNTINVDKIDSLVLESYTPTGLLSVDGFAADGISYTRALFGAPSDGDVFLLRGFEDSKNNGIYIVSDFSVPNSTYGRKFSRLAPYVSGSGIPNGTRINIAQNSELYVLNINNLLGSSIIDTDNLVFSLDSGSDVMSITSNKDVNFAASISATEKYFRIKHPDPNSKYSSLQYGSLESPYHGVRLTGKDKLKNGICEILLPDYLKHLIHEEDVSIQLTNYGHHKMLYVDKIDLKNNKFIIKGYRSKSGGPFNFYWSFTGIRKDVSILIPEQ